MLQFWGCNNGRDANGKSQDISNECQEFQTETHPVFLIISTVFLIITLFVYLAEDSLRYKNNTFKTIKIIKLKCF